MKLSETEKFVVYYCLGCWNSSCIGVLHCDET